ncbi:MAG: DUF4912 domain-containing protein [Spirochaetota bacterium]|jgi:hypothetical protein|nr:DUF4912 domain-containing protein [Spirochaetota bacterium]
MDKTTLKQKSKKELLNIAAELGLKTTARHTIDKLIEEILQALAKEKTPSIKKPAAQKSPKAAALSPQPKKGTPSPLPLHNEDRELPRGYGDTKIVAMVRDPRWIFAYWEISHEKKTILSKMGLNVKRPILRIYDITDVVFDGFNANSFFEIETNETTDNWYIHTPMAARTWCIDLGVKTSDGSFILIARSNTIVTPRELPSEQQAVTEGGGSWIPGESVFQKMRAITEGAFSWGDPESSDEPSSGNRPQDMGFGFSSSLSSDILSSSSLIPGHDCEDPGFRLLVHTELIVFGLTEPDADLTIQGKPVRLRPDGTFSIRFALPDGEQVIPVRAVSVHGDTTRVITPVIRRTTRES